MIWARETSTGASETAAAVRQIASTVEQVSNDVTEIASLSGGAAREAQKGSRGVDMLTERMQSITTSSERVALNAAKEISQMIAEVQSGSEKAVEAMPPGKNR